MDGCISKFVPFLGTVYVPKNVFILFFNVSISYFFFLPECCGFDLGFQFVLFKRPLETCLLTLAFMWSVCLCIVCACVELFWEALEEAAVSRRVCQVRDTWAELTLGYFGHPSALELLFLQAAATDNLFTSWQSAKHSAVHLWQGLKLSELSRAWLFPLRL